MTPLPKAKMFVVFIVLFCESLSLIQLFPYVAFMIKGIVVRSINFRFTYQSGLDFGLATNNNDVGFYAGFLASSFSVAQFLSSFFWGKLSDSKVLFRRINQMEIKCKMIYSREEDLSS